MRKKDRKGIAKQAVMTPEYRMRVEKDKTKYDKTNRKRSKEALKKGPFFILKKSILRYQAGISNMKEEDVYLQRSITSSTVSLCDQKKTCRLSF